MAILMVISAIQFIGVTCLMNHVILFLRPLKMKDWLLCWIKSSTLNRMNFASENTLPLLCPLSSLPLRWRERWVSDTSAFSYLAESSFKVAVSCYSEDFMFIFHKRITENMTWYHRIRHSTHTGCCWLLHFIIIYLWKCISRDRILESKILHKYWKSTRVWQHTLLGFTLLLNYFFSEHQYWTSLRNII